MLVHDFLELCADRNPNKTALKFDSKAYSYIDIEKKANAFANFLLDQGLNRHDRVAIYLPNTVDAVVSLFAILKAGGAFLIVNSGVKPKKLDYILNDCQVKYLITDKKHFAQITPASIENSSLEGIVLTDHNEILSSVLKGCIFYLQDILNDFPVQRPATRSIDIDLASLIYTSGSTGNPKGVMLTHLNMVSAATSIIQYLENTADDIILNVLPLSFDYGLYQVLMAFKFGGTVILESSFLYPYKILELLIQEKASGFPLVPTMAAILLKQKNLKVNNYPHLRYISFTGQVLPPQFIPRLQEIFTQAKIYSMYGLTECKRVSYLPPDELPRRPSSVGIAMPNTEVFLVDAKGQKISASGKVGELVIRGANVMKGYWNLPDESERALKPGPLPCEKVLHTGDLFKFDEDGYLYFVSRTDDLIKSGSERVSPKEIENVLYDHPEIEEAAVVGIEDEILGHAIKAVVSFKSGSSLDEKAVARYCAKNLEPFMVPKHIEIRKELPKTSHGKIDKKALK